MNWGKIIEHQQERYNAYMTRQRLMRQVCGHYQINPSQLTVIVLLLLSICISTGFGVDNMVSCFTYLYIARQTLATLYKNEVNTQDSSDPRVEQKYMMLFWFCYATLRCLEDVIHLPSWFPYYVLLKTAFLYILVQPKYKAAFVIYDNVLQPAIDRYGPYFARLESDTRDLASKLKVDTNTDNDTDGRGGSTLLTEALELTEKKFN